MGRNRGLSMLLSRLSASGVDVSSLAQPFMHSRVTPLGEKSIICVMFTQLLQLASLIHALLSSWTVVGQKKKMKRKDFCSS